MSSSSSENQPAKHRGTKRCGSTTSAPLSISPSNNNPRTRADLDDFVVCYHPANRHKRKATWSEENPDGRWCAFDYDELIARDKVNLDIFWLRDESLEETAPDVLAAEIVDNLQSALEQFQGIIEELGQED